MRHVLVGGEALPPALAARFQERLPHAHLHNAYGPTETTVDATGAHSLHAQCIPCAHGATVVDRMHAMYRLLHRVCLLFRVRCHG